MSIHRYYRDATVIIVRNLSTGALLAPRDFNEVLTLINEDQMGQEWILDVLADIRSFAVKNRMPQLADQLDDAMLVAAAEMKATANVAGDTQGKASLTNAAQVGNLHRSVTASENA